MQKISERVITWRVTTEYTRCFRMMTEELWNELYIAYQDLQRLAVEREVYYMSNLKTERTRLPIIQLSTEKNYSNLWLFSEYVRLWLSVRYQQSVYCKLRSEPMIEIPRFNHVYPSHLFKLDS